MAVQDLWYKTVEGKKVPSARHGRGKRWRVNHPGVPSESFDNKALAIKRDGAITTELDQGKYVDPRHGKILVDDYAAKWRLDQLHAPGTVATVEMVFRLYVSPYIGQTQMGNIRLGTLQKLIKELDAVLAPNSLRSAWAYISSMFRFAMDNGDIRHLPLHRLKLPERDPHTLHIPTHEQVKALFSCRLGSAYKVGAGCGLRGGEIFGLEPAAIDFDRRRIRVYQQSIKIKDQAPYLGPLKTKSSYREVEMPETVAEALKDHPTYVHTLWDRTNPRKPVERQVELFWETPESHQPYYHGTWTHVVRRDCGKVGIPTFCIRDLRHYYATVLIAQGATVKDVQRALGHSKASMTLDTYADYWPEHDGTLSAIIDRAWS